jgi:hypothetical protein
MKKLRFDLAEFIPAIARKLATQKGFLEVQPNMWVAPHYKDFYKQKRGVTKEREFLGTHRLEGIRYAQTPKGHCIFYDQARFESIPLVWCEADLKHLKQGFTHRIRLKKTMLLQLHVTHAGVVYFKNSSKPGIRSLSLRNLVVLSGILPTDECLKLLTLHCHQQWLEELLQVPGQYCLRFPITNNLVRGCSSLQQFINKINFSSHKVSAKQFVNMGLENIIDIMTVSSNLHNPHDLFEHMAEYLQEKRNHTAKYLLIEDYFYMCSRQGEKAWFSLNRERIRLHHDKAVLRELETAKVAPINIAPVAHVFQTYFPGDHYELIEDGARLKKEAILQRHCVSSYDRKINNFQCFIISVVHAGARYTAEISIKKHEEDGIRLLVNQFQGFGNTAVPDVLVEELVQLTHKFNDDGYKWKEVMTSKGAAEIPADQY